MHSFIDIINSDSSVRCECHDVLVQGYDAKRAIPKCELEKFSSVGHTFYYLRSTVVTIEYAISVSSSPVEEGFCLSPF